MESAITSVRDVMRSLREAAMVTFEIPLVRKIRSPAIVKATQQLAVLRKQTLQERAVLRALKRKVAVEQGRLYGSQMSDLRHENELLVLAMLRAGTDAKTAARALDEMSRSAELDPLTELPNRLLLRDRLVHGIATARRRDGQLAVLFLDLDNFKQINDTLGHGVGDEVLKQAAHCLASAVRVGDMVSRHGGDEFLVLLPEIAQASDAVVVAHKVIAALAAPRRVGNYVLRLTASIGISLYPDDGQDADTLIDRADAAMYRAKHDGVGRFALSQENTSQRGLSASALESIRPLLTPYPLALADSERLHGQLQEATEQLVLGVLAVQEPQPICTSKLQRRQKSLAAGVLDLSRVK